MGTWLKADGSASASLFAAAEGALAAFRCMQQTSALAATDAAVAAQVARHRSASGSSAAVSLTPLDPDADADADAELGDSLAANEPTPHGCPPPPKLAPDCCRSRFARDWPTAYEKSHKRLN